MAIVCDASAIRKKLRMLVYGEQGTGKSRFAMQFCYMKTPEGRPFRVLYLDTESGSIDDYREELMDNGLDPMNLRIVYTQSLAEVQDFIHTVADNEDFEDEDGNVWLDADGKPFRADAIVVDSATILNLTTKQGLTNFSQKRAKVKAAAQGLTGDEKSVKIEGAGMELKDYQQLNFKGQSLILDLNATGVSYIVICREKDETETKLVNGSSVSVSTGRKIPDGFKGQEYNVGTEFRMYHPGDDKSINFAYFDKDRTGVHNGGEVVEDLTLLEYQEYLDRSAKNREVIIKNGLNDAVKTEMKLRARELGLDDNDISDDAPAENTSESKEPSLDDIKAKLNDLIASASPVKKSAAQKAVKAAGLSTAFRSMTDIDELKKVAAIMEKELA